MSRIIGPKRELDLVGEVQDPPLVDLFQRLSAGDLLFQLEQVVLPAFPQVFDVVFLLFRVPGLDVARQVHHFVDDPRVFQVVERDLAQAPPGEHESPELDVGLRSRPAYRARSEPTAALMPGRAARADGPTCRCSPAPRSVATNQ